MAAEISGPNGPTELPSGGPSEIRGPNGGSLGKTESKGVPQLPLESTGKPQETGYIGGPTGGVPTSIFEKLHAGLQPFVSLSQEQSGDTNAPAFKSRITERSIEIFSPQDDICFDVEVLEGGTLTAVIQNKFAGGEKQPDIYPSQLFARALEHFEAHGVEVQTFQANWYEPLDSREISDNWVDYHARLAELAALRPDGRPTVEDKKEAAKSTWSGRLAMRHGFTEVSEPYLQERNDEGMKLNVLFRRPVRDIDLEAADETPITRPKRRPGGPDTDDIGFLPDMRMHVEVDDRGVVGEVMDRAAEIHRLDEEVSVVGVGTYTSADEAWQLEFRRQESGALSSHEITISRVGGAEEDQAKLVMDGKTGAIKQDATAAIKAKYKKVQGLVNGVLGSAGIDLDRDAYISHLVEDETRVWQEMAEKDWEKMGLSFVNDTQVRYFLQAVKAFNASDKLDAIDMPHPTDEQGPPTPETVEAFRKVAEVMAKQRQTHTSSRGSLNARRELVTVKNEDDETVEISHTQSEPINDSVQVRGYTIPLREIHAVKLVRVEDPDGIVTFKPQTRTHKDVDITRVGPEVYDAPVRARIASEMLHTFRGEFEDGDETDIAMLKQKLDEFPAI